MPKPVRLIFKLLNVFISLGIIVSGLILGGTLYFNSPPSGPSALALAQAQNPNPPDTMRLDQSGALIMEVRGGESAQSVGRRLENAGIIRNQYFWNILARISGEHIRAGTYRIELPASQLQIRSVLTAGQQILVRVTIPEGLTLRQTAEILHDAGVTRADDFLAVAASREMLDAFNIYGQTMEGYLFPDTYHFPLSYPAQRVVAAMAGNFFSRLAQVAPESAHISPRELHERVIMASIVEREYRVREEAALMAGVFYHRLRVGMRLESCATVVYVMTEIQGRPHPQRLFYVDLRIQNPFNTYVNWGLPPAPIASPGETALAAAFRPIHTDYLFFRVSDPVEGRHIFTRTLAEHNAAGIR